MLAECARILWRRRILSALALILALLAGVGTYHFVQPGQESKAQVLLVGSIKQPGVIGPTNPFMNLGGSLAVVASVLQVAVSDEKTAQRLADNGDQASYTLEPNLAENAGPVLLVTVDDKSSDMVQRTLGAVLDQIKRQLKSLQIKRGVKPDLYITAQVLTRSQTPKPVHKSQIQQAVVVSLAVLVVGIASILVFERFRVRRTRRVTDSGSGKNKLAARQSNGKGFRARARAKSGESSAKVPTGSRTPADANQS